MTLLGIILALYFLPAFIASLRKKRQVGAILVVNTLLGWTVVGWVVALVMAVWNDPGTQNAPASR